MKNTLNMTSTSLAKLDYNSLYKKADALRSEYAQNKPYPHITLDAMFDTALLEEIAKEVAISFKDIEKHFYGSVGKHATSNRKNWGPQTFSLLNELNSAEFLNFLERLTGIDGLISDPYYEGGGIHETKKGGFLKVHTDFNYHKKLKLDRRVNLLIYLNEDWKKEYGGELELWDSEMSECHKRVLPVINRMVVFSTTDFSYHGHPDPLQCPEDRSRKSLALYYYTNGRPASEIKGEKRTNTNYQERPDEGFDRTIKKPTLKKLTQKFKKIKNKGFR